MKLTIKKYIHLTPLTYFVGFFSYQAIIVPILSWNILLGIGFHHALETGILSLVFLVCVFFGWNISRKLFQKSFNQVMCLLSMRNAGRSFSQAHLRRLSILFFAFFVFSFIVLMYLSGAGTLWLTDSRVAYQDYRNGVGVFYAITTSLLSLSYVFSLYMYDNKNLFFVKTLPLTLFFSACAFFLGSKSLIMGFFVIMLVYYSYHVRPFRLWQVVVLFFAFLLSVSFLQFIQGTAQTTQDTILYANYFSTTTDFLRRFSEGEFSFQFGNVWISNVWGYVPRILYPNKPYEYGQLLINKVIFPGAAEIGHSPGLLPWAAQYLDFGRLGVVIYGVVTGCFLGWTHGFYANRNAGIVDFWILLKLGGFPAFFPFFPIPIFLLTILPFLSLTLSATKPRFYKLT